MIIMNNNRTVDRSGSNSISKEEGTPLGGIWWFLSSYEMYVDSSFISISNVVKGTLCDPKYRTVFYRTYPCLLCLSA